MSSAGALLDNKAASSPTSAIVPPEMPMSTSRPSASRQLARNASTSGMQSSRTVLSSRHAESAKRTLDHRRIEPARDEYQTRASVRIGPCLMRDSHLREAEMKPGGLGICDRGEFDGNGPRT